MTSMTSAQTFRIADQHPLTEEHLSPLATKLGGGN
jgi:hypothetical protein